MNRIPTIDDTDQLAARLHANSRPYGDRPYIEHPREVAELLYPYGHDAVRAGLLHDTVEDTDYTLDQMHADGFSDLVVATVDAVTRRPGETYTDFVRRAAQHWLGRIVKLADNNRNLATLHQAEDQIWAEKKRTLYLKARQILVNALINEVVTLDGFGIHDGIVLSQLDPSEGPYTWIAVGHHDDDAMGTACTKAAQQAGHPNLFADKQWNGGPITVGRGHAIYLGGATAEDWNITSVVSERDGHYRAVRETDIGSFKVTWIENPA